MAEKKQNTSVEKILSASRIKTYQECSWIYWCKYHLKLPENSNDGARRGNVCHLILELLLKPKWGKYYDSIMESGTVYSVPSIKRLIYKDGRKRKLTETEENYELIDKMLLVGFKTDFFCDGEGQKLLKPEFEFLIENKDPKYKIRGFVDKASKKGNKFFIKDYKTSAKKFEGDEVTFNVQALTYSLVGLKENPDCEPEAEFLFLKFPRKPIVDVKYTKAQLMGFEYFLAETYEKINNFTESDAKQNYAWDKPFPKKGFTGPLKCAKYCKKKGQLKKDGSVMWCCPFKFDFEYYATEKDGKVIETAFEKKDLKKEGKVVKKKYGGCPRYNQENKYEHSADF